MGRDRTLVCLRRVQGGSIGAYTCSTWFEPAIYGTYGNGTPATRDAWSGCVGIPGIPGIFLYWRIF